MRFLVILFYFFAPVVTAAQAPIGEWQEHLPYNSAIDVAAGEGQVFCATPYSLFSVREPGGTITRYSRVTGLNETGISTIAYDAANKKLVIAYTNSNIDILYRNDIFNIPGIKRANIAGDKTVFHIYPYAGNYYLSTGIGVIVLDGERYEVKDSWYIGNNGNMVRVNGFTRDDNFFYAATSEGLKKAPVNASNLANHTNWITVGGANGLAAGACQHVMTVGNTIIVQKDDSLFLQQSGNWSLLYTSGRSFVSAQVAENKLLVCERQSSGAGHVTILDGSGSVVRVLANTGAVSFPRKAILVNNDPWIADQYAGLSHFGSTPAYQSFIPSGPQAIGSGEMVVHKNVLYATSGAVNDAWNYQYNGDGVFRFGSGNWENINRYRFSQIDTLLDYLAIAIDPSDETSWAGSYGGGLLHIKPGPAFEIYKQNQLGPTVGDPGSYRVAGLAFDAANNLWVSNFGASQPLRVRKADGSWKAFTLPFVLFENALGQIIADEQNFKWIVSPLGNGLICYDHGNDIDDISDDRWRKYGGPGAGNLPNSEVQCIAKDKSGFIWVGTSDGIGVIQCPGDVFTAQGCDAIWPVVPDGNLAGYLFKGQVVRSIAVDGADRKWVATRNGVFLINAAGDRLVHRFTEDNSPLLSSDVKKIAIDGKTGTIYFATAKGLCSFRGTATDGGISYEEVLVFPNPVAPGYSGTIAVRGLLNNAIVKITELDGRLVYQSRALGGQVVWDGKNYRGQRIASGVYLVLVNDDGKTERLATKIFFISK